MFWDEQLGDFKIPFNDSLKICGNKHQIFVERASQLAQKSPCKTHRHGCVIVKDNEIVAEGYNHHCTYLHHQFSIHAEVHALSKLKYNRKIIPQCDMYVVRIGTDNMGNPLKFSRPCSDCTKAIEKSGIRKIYYSTNYPNGVMKMNIA